MASLTVSETGTMTINCIGGMGFVAARRRPTATKTMAGCKTLTNRTVTTFSRDAQGRLRDLANKNSSGTVLSDFSVPATGGYDGIGNRLSVMAAVNSGAPASYSGTTSYQYDYGQSANPALNRSQLTGETSTRASGTFSYGYDGGTSGGPGNPTSFKGMTNTFNSDNQVTNSGYPYDGNLTPYPKSGSHRDYPD